LCAGGAFEPASGGQARHGGQVSPARPLSPETHDGNVMRFFAFMVRSGSFEQGLTKIHQLLPESQVLNAVMSDG